MTKELVG